MIFPPLTQGSGPAPPRSLRRTQRASRRYYGTLRDTNAASDAALARSLRHRRSGDRRGHKGIPEKVQDQARSGFSIAALLRFWGWDLWEVGSVPFSAFGERGSLANGKLFHEVPRGFGVAVPPFARWRMKWARGYYRYNYTKSN